MVSSIAKRMHAMTNERVVVLDAKHTVRQSDVWDGLDYICESVMGDAIKSAPIREHFTLMVNGPSARPYYSHMEGNRIIWRKWDIAPGEIRLTKDEKEWAYSRLGGWEAKPFVVMGPTVKLSGGGGKNKDWGYRNWRKVADAIGGDMFVEFNAPSPPFAAHMSIKTPTFRHACAILERSIGYVGHEGGLHHAAAALGKPAVVVFGGYISPEVTGYSNHTNLYHPDPRYPLGCGTVTPCEHCREAMSKITVEEVVAAVKEMVR